MNAPYLTIRRQHTPNQCHRSNWNIGYRRLDTSPTRAHPKSSKTYWGPSLSYRSSASGIHSNRATTRKAVSSVEARFPPRGRPAGPAEPSSASGATPDRCPFKALVSVDRSSPLLGNAPGWLAKPSLESSGRRRSRGRCRDPEPENLQVE